MDTPVLGQPFDVHVPENSHSAATIVVIDKTSPGTFTPTQINNIVWSLRYQGLYHYNRSPWVERDYSAPVADVKLLSSGAAIPSGAWVIELVDVATEPGALGWHEDRQVQSTAHSVRGVKLHPDTGAEVPWAVVGVKTSREDSVQPSEVASHEQNEMLVDPWVMNESQLRVYTNPANGEEYIGEVGDAAQGRGYDVGAPEGRPCGVPEATMADICWPSWWGQPQTRHATTFCEDAGLAPRLEPFELAPRGYMSVRPKGGEWTPIYGSDKQKAEAAAHAYERPGDIG